MNKNIYNIIEPLKNLYSNKVNTLDVSESTKKAQSIGKDWQELFKDNNFIEIEVPICNGANEKIDLIDFDNQIAYELKVSGNNIPHEFYKDLFKVISFNINYPKDKVSTFVFISELVGIKKLKKSSLFKETMKFFESKMSEKFDIILIAGDIDNKL